METSIPRKLSIKSSLFYFLCVLVVALSPVMLRWIESASHVSVYRDAIGQPSDLWQNGGVASPVAGAPITPKREKAGTVSNMQALPKFASQQPGQKTF